MLKVTKKPKTPNMIWDAENNGPLCKFDRKGVLETNDETLAEKLKALGHTVTGEVDKVESPVEVDVPDSDGEPDAEDANSNAENDIPFSDGKEQGAEGEPDTDTDTKKSASTGKPRRSRK